MVINLLCLGFPRKVKCIMVLAFPRSSHFSQLGTPLPNFFLNVSSCLTSSIFEQHRRVEIDPLSHPLVDCCGGESIKYVTNAVRRECTVYFGRKNRGGSGMSWAHSGFKAWDLLFSDIELFSKDHIMLQTV